ncbi:MAG: formyltetrahydrofolate deformylase [Acidimicrobiales bacterium]
MATAVLLLTCADRPGIVAAVAEFVLRHGGNIVHAEQHTDRGAGVFFQRVEFELDGFGLAREEIEAAFAPIAERFSMQSQLMFSDARPRLALFVSKHGHCLYDLLARWRMRELPVDVAMVISNHLDHQPAAASFSVPFHHLAVGARHPKVELQALELMEEAGVGLAVLARYMQILSGVFVDRLPHRIINIHHSFLPAFVGAHPYRQAADRGVKLIGATAHYVTSVLDEGPIIDQDVVRVSHRDDVERLAQKGRDLEAIVLARAVRAHVEGRVLVYGNRTVVFS